MNLDSKELVDKVVEFIQSKKGFDITILDLRKLTAMADYFVICSASANVQVKAIADEVDKKLRKEGTKCYHREGYNSLNWVLLDYFDVVVHVFKEDVREFYNIEKLWGDADITEIENID
jgi:ribosome-associated protein